MSVVDLLVSIAEEVKDEFRGKEIPEGVNGPWLDDMEPTRNIAHTICLMSYAFKVTNNIEYFMYVKQLLLDIDKFELKNGLYLSRVNKNKFNGLIGQAWVVEAFLAAYKITCDDSLLVKAERIFLSHSFDYKNNGWVQAGGDKVFFKTLNQQIYFSAVLSNFLKLKPNVALQNNLVKNKREILFWLKDSFLGIPWHVVDGGLKRKFTMHNFKLTLGYYSFILLGLAVLCNNDEKFKKSCLDTKLYDFSNKVINKLIDSSPYAVSYNQTAIEIAIFKANLGQDYTFEIQDYIKSHKNVARDEIDYITHQLRVYEVIYLDDFL